MMRSHVRSSVSLLSCLAALASLAACQCGPTPEDAHAYKWEKQAPRDVFGVINVSTVTSGANEDDSSALTFAKASESVGGLNGSLSVAITQEVTQEIDWQLTESVDSFDHGVVSPSRTIVTDSAAAGSDVTDAGIPKQPDKLVSPTASKPGKFKDHPMQVEWSVVVQNNPSKVVSAGAYVLSADASQSVIQFAVPVADLQRVTSTNGIAPVMSTRVTVKQAATPGAKELLSLKCDAMPSGQLVKEVLGDYDRLHPPEYSIEVVVAAQAAKNSSGEVQIPVSLTVVDGGKKPKETVNAQLAWKLVAAPVSADINWENADTVGQTIDGGSRAVKVDGGLASDRIGIAPSKLERVASLVSGSERRTLYIVGRASISGPPEVTKSFKSEIALKNLVPDYSLTIATKPGELKSSGDFEIPVSLDVADGGQVPNQTVNVQLAWKLVAAPVSADINWENADEVGQKIDGGSRAVKVDGGSASDCIIRIPQGAREKAGLGSGKQLYVLGRASIIGSPKVEKNFQAEVNPTDLLPDYSLTIDTNWTTSSGGTLSVPVTVTLQDHGLPVSTKVAVKVEWQLVSSELGQEVAWDKVGQTVVKESTLTKTISGSDVISIDFDKSQRGDVNKNKGIQGPMNNRNVLFVIGKVSADKWASDQSKTFCVGPIRLNEFAPGGKKAVPPSTGSDSPSGN